ncbi:Aste57867_2886 [Aphanomyces stellatus]|uniref:subtilisin n=1 Tax=Aphanomyces stellatus TaxID=120398 RepID=A0A485KB16_9STRA|nr:hypothetical protein As57867_002878 [Aphanomyces stellatus]VFT80070.1 Aste57867_2886 [Aphanomyces stellatus]
MKPTLILAAAAAAVSAADTTKFTPDLASAFAREASEVTVLLKFKIDTDALNAAADDAAPEDRAQAVFDFLTQANEDSKQQVRDIVGPSAILEPLWIANTIAANLSYETAQSLAELEQIEIMDIDAKIELASFQGPVAAPGVESSREAARASVEWGVETIGAPAIWKYFTGKGVVVGSIDTGALATHEAIKKNWRSAKGWFDPYNRKLKPYDSQGHGSHTIGTMVGANGIGVAPDAQWISCMGLNGKTGTNAKLLQCAQFMLCPTDADGTKPDCKKAPHVVNNSWGGSGPYSPFFENIVAAWKAANIIPIFANGNEGPSCETTGMPGGYASVISVGAVGSQNNDPNALAYFSSKGSATVTDPSTGETVTIVKPDVSAPGFWTRSVGIKSNTEYVKNAGTSMAAPHVAGVVALLKSADKTITYDQVYKYLTQTTDQSVLDTTEPDFWSTNKGDVAGGPNCGGVDDASWPNNRFGNGRVNVATILRDGRLHDSRQ